MGHRALMSTGSLRLVTSVPFVPHGEARRVRQVIAPHHVYHPAPEEDAKADSCHSLAGGYVTAPNGSRDAALRRESMQASGAHGAAT